eukprot:Opistho-2@44912
MSAATPPNNATGGVLSAALRSNIVAGGVDERVEVNQRHLIDKILARYSAEHTIFRELLQNSNDAGATHAEIEFVCAPGNRKAMSVVYRNNGRPFRKEDWGRLKKIAEGNPDENKIGFFGVGFYSVFSVSEEPLVVSGDSCMAFHWKGDQLYSTVGTLPAEMKSRLRMDTPAAAPPPSPAPSPSPSPSPSSSQSTPSAASSSAALHHAMSP